MGGLWMGGLGGMRTDRIDTGSRNTIRNNESLALNAAADIKELRHQVERLTLLNQAMWEMVRDKAGFTDAELEHKAEEIDLRDGQKDGKIGGNAVTCPTCSRVSNAKHFKCLYCGELFEKPLFG